MPAVSNATIYNNKIYFITSSCFVYSLDIDMVNQTVVEAGFGVPSIPIVSSIGVNITYNPDENVFIVSASSRNSYFVPDVFDTRLTVVVSSEGSKSDFFNSTLFRAENDRDFEMFTASYQQQRIIRFPDRDTGATGVWGLVHNGDMGMCASVTTGATTQVLITDTQKGVGTPTPMTLFDNTSDENCPCYMRIA
jgi:hypothetical protein